MTRRKFQVGDKVRIKRFTKNTPKPPDFHVGHVCKVEDYDTRNNREIMNYYIVRRYGGREHSSWVSAREIEKV